MEAPEEVQMVSKDQSNIIVKGKRTKRFRPQSPIPFAVASSNSIFNTGDHMENKENYGDYLSLSSSSEEYQDSAEDDEDVANCLIMLARGQSRESPKLLSRADRRDRDQWIVCNKFNSRKFMEAASDGTGAKVGYYVYECKTCNRTFPSFQALGGHRASHKKPKSASAALVDEKIRQLTAGVTTTIGLSEEDEGLGLGQGQGQGQGQQQFMKTHNISSLSYNNHNNNNKALYGNNNTTTINDNNNSNNNNINNSNINNSNNNNNVKSNKIHECLICGSEFTSGQALGGHMRRHRGSIGSNSNNNTTNTALSLNVATTPMEQPQQHHHQQQRPKKPKNVLSLDLDLNLPAPDDDQWEQKFPFASKQQQQQSSHVFNTPTLVDCHY